MKNLFLYIVVAFFLTFSTVSAAGVFQPVQGGTGISSATAGQIGDCLSVSNNSPFTYTLGTCGSGSGSTGNVATSSQETSGLVPFWTSTNATPATLSGGVSAFAWSSALSRLTATNASTTAFTNSGPTWFTNLSGGFAYIGSAGKLNTTASSSINLSWLNNDAGFLTGNQTITLTGDVSGSGATSISTVGKYSVATGSTISIPQVAYFTKTGGITTLGGVSTSSLGVTAPITFSGTIGSQVGGIGGNFGCTNASAGVTGCLTGTDWTTFNNKLGSYDAWTHAQAGMSATTSAIGVGTTTPWAQLSVSTSTASSPTTPLFAIASNTAASIFTVFGSGKIGVATTTPAALFSINPDGFGSGPMFIIGSSSKSVFQVTNTGVSSSSAFVLSNVLSALHLGGSDGTVSAYGGTSCTNQFVRSLNGAGVATCASSDDPFTHATFYGQSDSATSTMIHLTGSPYSLTASSTSEFDSATSTYFTATNYLQVPNTSATSSPAGTGATFINTSSASSSLRWNDGTIIHSAFDTGFGGLPFASSTLAYIGSYGASGTTTINLANPPRSISITQFYCKTDTGTVYAEFGNYTSSSTVQCTSSGVLKSTPFNYIQNANVYLAIGTQSGNPNIITITPQIRQNAD